MTHDEISELLGAYALDAVDPDERDVVEAHLATCARCRAEVADHREVAALLANSGTDAPEGLWDRIAGSLEETPPELDLAPVTQLESRRHRPRFATALAAAAAVLIIAGLGLQVRDQGRRIDELQTALADPMAPAFQDALDDPGSRVFELTSSDKELVVRGAITPTGLAYLRAAALPDLPDDRAYQLWGIAGDDLVSLGVFGDDPSVISFRGDHYRGFAITEEVAAGVVRSRNQPVVVGTLS